MPDGPLVTMPFPETPTMSVWYCACGCWVNVAVTVVLDDKVTLQEPVPVHAPLQPVNVEPVVAAAVKVTAVPGGYVAEQLVPHVMPFGEPVTVPLPVPALVTVRPTGDALNVAVTVVVALGVTVQAPVPVQPPPLQPAKVEPVAGVAVNVTAVPLP